MTIVGIFNKLRQKKRVVYHPTSHKKNKFNQKAILWIVFCSFETGLSTKKAVVGSGLTAKES